MLAEDTASGAGIPGAGGGLQLFLPAITPIPPAALLLERSLVNGFGFLGKKVYTFLKDKDYEK